MSELIVSLHDVAPSKAELCRRWVGILNERNIRATLLVVPGQWNGASLDTSPQFVDWLRGAEADGHEIALHGYHHIVDTKYRTTHRRQLVGTLTARGCEEFWHLPYAEAHRRIRLGRETLERYGFCPRGFVAPGWLMSPETMMALRQTDLLYTTTHTHFIDLLHGREEKIISLSQRPNSVLTKGGIAINFMATEAARSLRAPMRLAIHPNDLINVRVRNANLSIIDRFVNRGYETMTYAEKHQSLSAKLSTPDSVRPESN